MFCFTAEDLLADDPVTIIINLAFFPPSGSAGFSPIIDGIQEELECLVLEVSINESLLDPRDQGQVDISNGVALVRIEDLSGECCISDG